VFRYNCKNSDHWMPPVEKGTWKLEFESITAQAMNKEYKVVLV